MSWLIEVNFTIENRNGRGDRMQEEQKLFQLKAPYEPTGDQPQAIEQLVQGFKEGLFWE